MFKWHEKSTSSFKLQKFVIFAIRIFFALSSLATIAEMASASLVLFMLIRPLWRLRRIPLLQTHKWMACVYLCTVIQSKKYSWISYWNINSKITPKCIDLFLRLIYHKVVRIRPVYYSILDSLDQRSQYISIKFPLHKQSENPKMCY